MGKSTISMAIFNSYVKLPEGITHLAPNINPILLESPLNHWVAHLLMFFDIYIYTYIYIYTSQHPISDPYLFYQFLLVLDKSVPNWY